jgi:transcriptional regulator with XRE-family HTH domain
MTSRRSHKQKQESDSPLETLRIERTDLNQDEFAMRCGIPRATYQRWISGNTEARLTLDQVKKLCRELKIKNLEELPNSFGPPNFSKKPED